jgi:hypothetical protein
MFHRSNNVIRRFPGRTKSRSQAAPSKPFSQKFFSARFVSNHCAVRLAPTLRQLILFFPQAILCATMNRRLSILMTFFACALLHPVCAAEQLNEEQLEQLAQQYPKLYLPKLIAFTEGKLERVYQARLKASRPEYRAALRKAQGGVEEVLRSRPRRRSA